MVTEGDPYWWETDPGERFWCEITGRDDIGADLKAPQTKENGQAYWSYALLNEIKPGEVVFHYSTPKNAFVGVSIAAGRVEERPIVWTPQGATGRAKHEERGARPGWWVPLREFHRAERPLSLEALQSPEHQAWLREWIARAQEQHGATYAPIQPYPGRLRAAQGYVTKMPKAFVERFEPLRALVASLGPSARPSEARSPKPEQDAEFSPKPDTPYTASVPARIEVRSRDHEALVRFAGERLRARRIKVSTPHPIDLRIDAPLKVLLEAKLVDGDPRFAIRHAVGQLLEYGYFVGPEDARLGVLLDKPVGSDLVRYVEDHLGLLLFWKDDTELRAAPKTEIALSLALADPTASTSRRRTR
jgi:hypothetical protein